MKIEHIKSGIPLTGLDPAVIGGVVMVVPNLPVNLHPDATSHDVSR